MHSITSGVGVGHESVGVLILTYIWRVTTDPITRACWAGLTGYFIGLAVSGHGEEAVAGRVMMPASPPDLERG